MSLTTGTTRDQATRDTPGGIGPASRLADRYRLVEQIGSGGMGRIYRAHDERLDRDVAIKLLEPDADAADVSASEARAAARLAHPGLAQVFDVGRQHGLEYIVMELVRGRSLREVLAARRRLSPAESVSIGAQLADALAHAHRHGVVHCDVKPRNVMLTPDGTVKLLDFGIAQGTGTTRTLPLGEIRGSAAYLSPEQVRGERPDGRSDVYALGALLFELLTGRQLFLGPDVRSVLVQRLVADPPRPRQLNPAISPALERVLLKALARNPTERFQSAGQLRDALAVARGDARSGAWLVAAGVWLAGVGTKLRADPQISVADQLGLRRLLWLAGVGTWLRAGLASVPRQNPVLSSRAGLAALGLGGLLALVVLASLAGRQSDLPPAPTPAPAAVETPAPEPTAPPPPPTAASALDPTRAPTVRPTTTPTRAIVVVPQRRNNDDDDDHERGRRGRGRD